MKKRIRFIINTLEGGGAEKVLIELLQALGDQDYEIFLVSISGGRYEAVIPDYVIYRNITEKIHPKFKKIISKVIRKLPGSLFSFLFLRGKFDIEIAYLEGLPTRILAAKKTLSPRIAFVHCDVTINPAVLPIYRSEKQCLKEYRKFSRVCFVSNQVRESFERTIGDLNNGVVVHNVLNIGAIKEKAKEVLDVFYKTSGIKLVTVGRLSEQKGYERLFDIVAELEKQYDFELWVIGDGEDRNKLEEIINKKQISSIKMFGFATNPYKYVNRADMFVCSSLSEGYSTAVAEAIALGVPVLATECAGMDEILKSGEYGWIVNNSYEGLKKGLIWCLEHPDLVKQKAELIEWYSSENYDNSSLLEYKVMFDELLK